MADDKKKKAKDLEAKKAKDVKGGATSVRATTSSTAASAAVRPGPTPGSRPNRPRR